jgi:hypothetical protein
MNRQSIPNLVGNLATQPEQLVTLHELVAEGDLVDGDSVDQIALRLGGEVLFDDIGHRW